MEYAEKQTRGMNKGLKIFFLIVFYWGLAFFCLTADWGGYQFFSLPVVTLVNLWGLYKYEKPFSFIKTLTLVLFCLVIFIVFLFSPISLIAVIPPINSISSYSETGNYLIRSFLHILPGITIFIIYNILYIKRYYNKNTTLMFIIISLSGLLFWQIIILLLYCHPS